MSFLLQASATSTATNTTNAITGVGVIVAIIAIVVSIVFYQIIYNDTIVKKGKERGILQRIHNSMKKCFNAYTENIKEEKKRGIVSAIVMLDRCRSDINKASKHIIWAIIDMAVLVIAFVLIVIFVSPFGITAVFFVAIYVCAFPSISAYTKLQTLWNLYQIIEEYEGGEEQTIVVIAKHYRNLSRRGFDYKELDS